MSSSGSNPLSTWSQWCLILSASAPTYGSEQRCLHLRPGVNKTQVQEQLTQTQWAFRLTREADPFASRAFLKDKHWLKEGAKTPAKAAQYLPAFLALIGDLKQALPESKALWPPLKADIQPHTDPRKAQHVLQQHRHAIEQQLQVIDEIGVWYAKAQYGRQRKLQLSHISQQQAWDLKQLTLPGLHSPLDLHWQKDIQTLLVNGSHQSGKSALLKGLYLLIMQHQSGVPCSGEPMALPVFRGIHWLPAHQNLSERLQALKPLLHSQAQERLILIDDFLAHSAPGESHALAKAIMEQLHTKGSLNLISTYDRLLLRHAQTVPHTRILYVTTQHKKTQIQWDHIGEAGLFQAARYSGLPSHLIQQAEKHFKALQQPAASQPKPKAVAVASKASPRKNTAPQPPADTPTQEHQPVPANVRPGTRVYIPQLQQYGEVVKPLDRRGKVQVRCEGMFMHLSPDALRLSSHRQEKRQHHDPVTVSVSAARWEPVDCDLHGLNVLEAIPVLEKHLDMAYHAGEKQLRVVHGKGTSTLRRAVHEHLESLIIHGRYAEAYRLGYTGEGDSGVTIVTLK